MQGFFENRTEQSDQWYHELFDGQDWVLRVPGGAIAKFADPTVSRGWGLTYDGIDSIQPAYGNPEEEAQENALQKWRRKADAQPDISYLPELVAFCQEFGCKVIWVANIFIPTNKAVYPVQYLLDNGVEVVAVELGNETYSQVDHDFGQFLSKSQGCFMVQIQWTSYFIPCCANGKPFKERPSGVEQLFAIILLRQLRYFSQVLRWARIFRLETAGRYTTCAIANIKLRLSGRVSINEIHIP